MRKLWFLAVPLLVAALPARVEAQFFSENFDSYVAGSLIAGQGGWETWDLDPGVNAPVSNAQALGPPNSLLIAGVSDIVHQFPGVTSGVWYAAAWTYVPSTQSGELWFILLNMYAPGGPDNWSAQVVMCVSACTSAGALPGFAVNIGGSEVGGGGSAPLITNQWVEVRAQVDLGANTYTMFYNGVPIDTQQWTISGNLAIQAMDLFSNGSTESYYDNVWLDTTVPVEVMSFTVS
jgi:hypothetical protein